MTIGTDSQNLESYLPPYDVVPKTWEEGGPFFIEQIKEHANAINVREIGFYLDQELLTGKSFIPGLNDISDGGSSQVFRSILRKVIVTGALPRNATKSVPHGITFDANFSLIDMWLAATDPVNFLAFSLAYWDKTGTSPITVNMDSTNINITTTGNYSAYTTSYVVVEYIQEP